ncbi:MAG: peptidase M50 [Candidatus Tectimicrobiota bacterium]|nr:MAG: peptidase M50 [Candidatus Tectomicrobia bacterium]
MFDPAFLLPFLPVFLLALTLHEFAHAWTAWRYGDPTPRLAGRLTLNPLRHLDPLGTLCLFLAYVGWAKPVPVNPAYFTHRRAELYVSLAGIVANFLQAVGYALLWHFVPLTAPAALALAWHRFLWLGVLINLSLALFNLLPLFPLDGAHVLKHLLPRPQAQRFQAFGQRYGAALLVGLLLVGYVSEVSPLGLLIGVPRDWLARLLLGV